MKTKIFILGLMFALMIGVVTCTAARRGFEDDIPAADIAIGGIALGASESYVKSIYGEPDDISFQKSGFMGYRTKTYRYGNSFFIMFWQGNKGGTAWSVVDVKTTANNGLKTPKGFTVGMSRAAVIDYYGAGRGDETYSYYHAIWYLNIVFKFEAGKISEINIYPTP